MPDERASCLRGVLRNLPDGAPVVVSACLLGEPCRYDGSSKTSAAVCSLVGRLTVLPVCPERAAGLPCPRPPAEAQANGRIVLRDGTDVSAAFARGAQLCASEARDSGARLAILKEKSPSCGVRQVYDGTFSGRLVPGTGVFARLLAQAGVTLASEGDALALVARGLDQVRA